MDTNEDRQIAIQILVAREGDRAVDIARERLREIADIARGQGAEALLVCPAAAEFTSEGIDLVIGARFRQGLDEDAVFWRQRSLAQELHDALRVDALVLDLDLSLDGYVKSIQPMLATPYRDKLGRRGPPAVS